MSQAMKLQAAAPRSHQHSSLVCRAHSARMRKPTKGAAGTALAKATDVSATGPGPVQHARLHRNNVRPACWTPKARAVPAQSSHQRRSAASRAKQCWIRAASAATAASLTTVACATAQVLALIGRASVATALGHSPHQCSAARAESLMAVACVTETIHSAVSPSPFLPRRTRRR